MEHQGIVVAAEGDSVRVRLARMSGCDGCAGKAACGTLGGWRRRFVELRLPNRIGARPGDIVRVHAPDHAVLRLGLWVYGMPLLLFLAAGLVSEAWFARMGLAHADLAAAALGLAAMGGYFGLWLPRHAPRVPDARLVGIERAASAS